MATKKKAKPKAAVAGRAAAALERLRRPVGVEELERRRGERASRERAARVEAERVALEEREAAARRRGLGVSAFYGELGMRGVREGSVIDCFARRGDAHASARRVGDRVPPSCEIEPGGNFHCKVCGSRGSAYSSARLLGFGHGRAVELLRRYGLHDQADGAERDFAEFGPRVAMLQGAERVAAVTVAQDPPPSETAVLQRMGDRAG